MRKRQQGKKREKPRHGTSQGPAPQPRRQSISRGSLSLSLCVPLSSSLSNWLEYSVSSPRHLVPHFILDLELLFLFSTVLPPSPPYPRYSTLRLDKSRSYHSQLTNLCRPRIPPQYLSATVTPGVRGQVRPACNWTLAPNIRQSRARPRWHCVDGAWSSEAVGQWALWLAARGPA
jgi:hypothetical protein